MRVHQAGISMDEFFTTNAPPPRRRVIDEGATADQRTYATFVHLSTFLMFAIGVPLVAPLVLWLIKRNESLYISDHGKEAINFNISIIIYYLVGLLLVAVCGLGFLVIGATFVLTIVGPILAAFAANRGEIYRYPACLRLIA
ncbi:MAG: DUF4870 domain-containing protein [Phycisphaeraceae bacterium]|nr:DUF4870 domain-containing protein [Phycisphaeraceae bacterium]